METPPEATPQSGPSGAKIPRRETLRSKGKIKTSFEKILYPLLTHLLLPILIRKAMRLIPELHKQEIRLIIHQIMGLNF